MEHVLDATNKKIGRIASEAAVLLQGKNTPAYNPRLLGGNKVVVKNTSKLSIEAGKMDGKIYYHHTGYIGHLKERTLREQFTRSPQETLRKAIYNMLPKNRLRAKRLKRLTIEK